MSDSLAKYDREIARVRSRLEKYAFDRGTNLEELWNQVENRTGENGYTVEEDLKIHSESGFLNTLRKIRDKKFPYAEEEK